MPERLLNRGNEAQKLPLGLGVRMRRLTVAAHRLNPDGTYSYLSNYTEGYISEAYQDQIRPGSSLDYKEKTNFSGSARRGLQAAIKLLSLGPTTEAREKRIETIVTAVRDSDPRHEDVTVDSILARIIDFTTITPEKSLAAKKARAQKANAARKEKLATQTAVNFHAKDIPLFTIDYSPIQAGDPQVAAEIRTRHFPPPHKIHPMGAMPKPLPTPDAITLDGRIVVRSRQPRLPRATVENGRVVVLKP